MKFSDILKEAQKPIQLNERKVTIKTHKRQPNGVWEFLMSDGAIINTTPLGRISYALTKQGDIIGLDNADKLYQNVISDFVYPYNKID